MFACLLGEHFLHLPRERDRARQNIFSRFARDCGFREHREIETATVLLSGLRRHLVHHSRQLLETVPQPGIRPPKSLHGRADDYLARGAV